MIRDAGNNKKKKVDEILSIVKVSSLLFSAIARGDCLMDVKNIRKNEKYDFLRQLNGVFNSEYFVSNLIRFIEMNMNYYLIQMKLIN